MEKELRVLFIGDVFGVSGIQAIEKHLDYLKEKYKVDLVIAQAENVSGRKGMNVVDYTKLKDIGIDIFTLGNHVWANQEIHNIIDNNDIVRPYNVEKGVYPGSGSNVFNVKNFKIRITSLLGKTFNKLNNPWKQEEANSFFDSIDEILEVDNNSSDFHIIDFHAETTSEKNVFGLYVDGKVDAILGTHTHVQTNDDKILPEGTLYITDVGMTGPKDSAIGANFLEVYEKMRYNQKSRFKASDNKAQFNAVFLILSKDRTKRKIEKVFLLD
ncbi:TIGR00282 family metallophosphoesterase [Mesomycoplasma molare]|uniref:YmdB family metallophosphoesterase n=1 Tax=Mesomycoplasma molare TaxID=171288 RepID=A0ABY5TVP0_9BACT|nr:TIGR00282 family metallophosphoesterase [Mesomycoplasma molare]UWD34285.1 YmdB family metallophosphoesterase [Mesomycoplasma molare]